MQGQAPSMLASAEMGSHCWGLGISAWPRSTQTKIPVLHSPLGQPGLQRSHQFFVISIRKDCSGQAQSLPLPRGLGNSSSIFMDSLSSHPAPSSAEIPEPLSLLNSSSCHRKPSSVFRTSWKHVITQPSCTSIVQSPAFMHQNRPPKAQTPWSSAT